MDKDKDINKAIMKTIVLIPAKNEEWILEDTLKNTTPHADLVLIADQQSTDRTAEICKKFQNVKVIQNPHIGHSNKVRWLLLDEARKLSREMSGESAAHDLMICIDADEMISPKAIEEMKKIVEEGTAKPGDVFRFKWIQLWKGIDQYMEEGVWKDNFKNIAFIDNPGVNEYKKEFVINDHTTRVPDTNMGRVIAIYYPLLHFHFVAWKRTELKQAWYRASELIEGSRNAKRINNTYRITLMRDNIETYPVPAAWTEGLELPVHLSGTTSSWHLEALQKYFDERGIEFFEALQIWHIPELRQEFVKRIGREPISQTYPAWLSALNEVKNFARNKILPAITPKHPLQNMIQFLRSITPLWLRIKVGPFIAWLSYIFNLYIRPNQRKPHVLSLQDTLDIIIKNDLSAIRFGDGEMSLIENYNLGFQNSDPKLAQRLKEVLISNHQKLLICIPGIFGRMNLFATKTFWFNLHHLFKHGHNWKEWLSPTQTYGEAFISRPYLLYKDKSRSGPIFKKLFSIWQDKDVVLVEGDKSRLGVGNDLFDGVKSLRRILAPSENAYAKYDEILAETLKLPKDTLILLSLGPTAKVLAYDLFRAGYRVMDIGHIDMEYEMFLRQSAELTRVPFKYFNEIEERNPEDCTDPNYRSQIIARIN